MGGWGHLARRFVGSLWPAGPSKAKDDWARSQMTDPEQALWLRMKGFDRRHAVAVAQRVERALGAEADRSMLAAALLHDVGKVEADLGVYGRVAATLSGKLAGRDMADNWRKTRGFTRRVGLYLHHPDL